MYVECFHSWYVARGSTGAQNQVNGEEIASTGVELPQLLGTIEHE